MDLEHNQQTQQFTDEKVEEIEIEENNLEVSSHDSENDMNKITHYKIKNKSD